MLNAVNIAATFQSSKLISIDDNLNARENVIRVTNKPRNSRKIVFIEKLSLGFARSISVEWNIYIYKKWMYSRRKVVRFNLCRFDNDSRLFLFTNVLRVLSYVEDNFQVMRPLITDNYHTSWTYRQCLRLKVNHSHDNDQNNTFNWVRSSHLIDPQTIPTVYSDCLQLLIIYALLSFEDRAFRYVNRNSCA